MRRPPRPGRRRRPGSPPSRAPANAAVRHVRGDATGADDARHLQPGRRADAGCRPGDARSAGPASVALPAADQATATLPSAARASAALPAAVRASKRLRVIARQTIALRRAAVRAVTTVTVCRPARRVVTRSIGTAPPGVTGPTRASQTLSRVSATTGPVAVAAPSGGKSEAQRLAEWRRADSQPVFGRRCAALRRAPPIRRGNRLRSSGGVSSRTRTARHRVTLAPGCGRQQPADHDRGNRDGPDEKGDEQARHAGWPARNY